MGMMDAQRRICRKAFFSDKRLGEHISYNGKDIVALVYVGVSDSRSDWNEAKTVVENASLIDAAYFCVCDEGENGVLTPSEGDAIIYNGARYSVSNIVEHDVAGSHYVLLASKAERAFGR